MFELLYDTQMKIAGINFTAPKGFYIFTDEGSIGRNGLAFVPKEQDCRIDIYTVASDTNDNLKENFIKALNSYITHGKVQEQLRSYVYSIGAEYEIDESNYFEVHFGKHKDFNERIQLLITVNKHKADIREVLNRRDIQKLLDSFEIISYLQ